MCDAMVTPDGVGPLNVTAVQLAARELAAEGLRVLAMAHRALPAGPLDPQRINEPEHLILAGL